MSRVRNLAILWCICAFPFVFGCGNDDSGSTVQDGDRDADEMAEIEESQPIQGDTDLEEEAAEQEEEVPPPVLEPIAFLSTVEPTLDETFDLDPDGRSCQIHVAAKFDGVGVWIVYNRPDEQNKFDVYATRIACDGQVLVAPFKVNTTDANETEPDLDLDGDRLVFVWQSDNGEQPNNLSIHYRMYSLDGTPQMDEDRVMRPVRNDGEEAINAWMAKVVALPEGRFAIVGAWADPDTISEDNPGKWQVFSQVIDSEGEPLGSVVKPHFDPSTSQVFPDAGTDVFGNLYVAWENDDDQVQYNVIPYGAATPESETPYDTRQENGAAGVDIAAYRAENAPVYLVFTTLGADEGDVMLIDASRKNGGTTNVRLASTAESEHGPVIAVSPDRGAAVYYATQENQGHYLSYVGFRKSGSELETTMDAVHDTSASLPPYQPTITHIKDEIYFMAWSVGNNPDFYIKGAFYDLGSQR